MQGRNKKPSRHTCIYFLFLTVHHLQRIIQYVPPKIILIYTVYMFLLSYCAFFGLAEQGKIHCCTLPLSTKSNQIKSIHLFSKHLHTRIYSMSRFRFRFVITAIDLHVQSRFLVVRAPRLSWLYDLWMVHWWVIGGCKDGHPERYWSFRCKMVCRSNLFLKMQY